MERNFTLIKFTQPYTFEYERREGAACWCCCDLWKSQNNIENKLQLASLLNNDNEFLEERGGGGSAIILSKLSLATFQSITRLHFLPHSDSLQYMKQK